MTKPTFFLSFIGLSLLAILTFSLSKSWMFLDKGINLSDEENPKEEVIEKEQNTSDDHIRESKVIWKNFIYYPTDLIKEEGNIGPNKILHHAKNLTFVNLTNGKLRNIFEKKVYIYDYFPGDLSLSESDLSPSKNKVNQIDIGNKFIILIMNIDTNKDGYLNHKDKARVVVYDPSDEKVLDILPENYFFESLLMNTKKNTLALVVREGNVQKSASHPSQFFIYDSLSEKGILVKTGESFNFQ